MRRQGQRGKTEREARKKDGHVRAIKDEAQTQALGAEQIRREGQKQVRGMFNLSGLDPWCKDLDASVH